MDHMQLNIYNITYLKVYTRGQKISSVKGQDNKYFRLCWPNSFSSQLLSSALAG